MGDRGVCTEVGTVGDGIILRSARGRILIANSSEAERFYSRLFTTDPDWSTRHPNMEEARRVAKIVPLLTRVAGEAGRGSDGLRILDLGCGRGWLTYIADAYGHCVGIDPVAPVIEFARERYPSLTFEVGSTSELLAKGHAGAYDLVIASEVIEHVAPAQCERFVTEVAQLLTPAGSAIVTSDRGELHSRWLRREHTTEQPEENWFTESQLRALFEGAGFVVAERDRAYFEVPELSLFHRVVASLLRALHQEWLLHGLQYQAANCQVWLFRRA
jgi:SAM-dependent methyltransferase